MNALLWSILLSMSPVFELRAGLPVAVASGFNPWFAFFVCVLANCLVVPFVFLFLEFIHYRFLHHGGYRSAFDMFMERTRQKVQPFVEKYGMVGLTLFVAVPVPGTGAYAASLIAWFLGMNKWQAFLAISAGVVASGIIVLGLVGAILVLVV